MYTVSSTQCAFSWKVSFIFFFLLHFRWHISYNIECHTYINIIYLYERSFHLIFVDSLVIADRLLQSMLIAQCRVEYISHTQRIIAVICFNSSQNIAFLLNKTFLSMYYGCLPKNAVYFLYNALHRSCRKLENIYF